MGRPRRARSREPVFRLMGGARDENPSDENPHSSFAHLNGDLNSLVWVGCQGRPPESIQFCISDLLQRHKHVDNTCAFCKRLQRFSYHGAEHASAVRSFHREPGGGRAY